MFCFNRAVSFAFMFGFVLQGYSQLQDKEQSKAMLELSKEMLKASQAEDDVRDIMVQAADLDTTNLTANFEAGRLHLNTIKKEQAVKYLLRIYRQNPKYRFDLEFHIAASYQYGLQFDKAVDFYNRYKAKLTAQPKYQGKDKVSIATIERRLYECNNGKEFVANPKPFAIVNIGPQINSEANDYAPVLNEAEDEIIFTSRRLDGNLNENVFSDNKPFEDIFISRKVNGKWTRAANIGRSVNIPNHNSNLAISPDGKMLYSYRDDNGGDIFVSELKPDNSWSPAKPIPGSINTPDMESSMSVTADGNTLYFASERPGGFGGIDIYVATKDGKGNWGKVKNLGATINTERHEDGPFIDYSGKKLYFSSESHKGMGGYDIFESNLINPSKNEWSTPLNVGYPINTADNDIYFVETADGKRDYYASVRDDGLGYLDVYMIVPKELVKKSESVLPVHLQVKVIDAKANLPLDAKVELLSLSDGKPVEGVTKTKGTYTFTVTTKDPKMYRLSVSKEGYFPQVEEISLQSADMVEKTVPRTVGMAKSQKEIVIVPLKYVVKVVDAKTNLPIEASVRLETAAEKNPIAPTPKESGTTEFSIISPTANNYTVNVEISGYAPQSFPVKLDGASTATKTINRTVSLTAIMKVPTVVPIKYVVKVVDSKTNLPIDATVKMESQPEKELVTMTTQGGTAQFPLGSPTIKIYKLTAEREGYSPITEQVRIEAATTVEKTLNKTISMVEVKKEPKLAPLKLIVKVVDEKTKLALEVNLKLESPEVSVQTGATSKATGSFEFSSLVMSPKEVILTAERIGYVSKTERFTLEGATAIAKTITRTITLVEEKKAPIIVPLKLTVKVVDGKTKLPLDADIKIESEGEPMILGKTAKATGAYVLTITTPTTKEYTLTAEKSGYALKSEKYSIEGAGAKAKWITKIITLQPIVKDVPPVSTTIASVKLTVTILDKNTSLPIEANVMLQSPSDKSKVEAIAKGNGVYEFSITAAAAKDYKISADREGYVYLAQQIRIEGATDKEKILSRTLSLQPIAVGTTSVLRNLFFDSGKATIKQESYPELNGFENMMKQNPTIRVEISGHTDDVGDNAFNKNLSQLRANAVKGFLVSKGIEAKRLVPIGHGETRPLVSNDDEAGGREINRRVELKILSK